MPCGLPLQHHKFKLQPGCLELAFDPITALVSAPRYTVSVYLDAPCGLVESVTVGGLFLFRRLNPPLSSFSSSLSEAA